MNNGAGDPWGIGERIGVVITLLVLLGGALIELYLRARNAKSAAERRFLLRWIWALGIEHVLFALGLLLLSVRGVVGISIAWGIAMLPMIVWFKRGEARFRAVSNGSG